MTDNPSAPAHRPLGRGLGASDSLPVSWEETPK
jgi:hypothetical protein